VLQHVPELKPEDQLPALGRVINLLPDDRYEAAQRALLDPRTSIEAKEFLYHDAANRPSEVKLPAMFAIMTARHHPQAEEAHQSLINELGNDFGANQGEWLARIHEELQRQSQAGK
ncbi:MAG: hypothetical protein JWO94_1170, partial [Verrucomicrobiaceae bacterium]|nr:hypothetical protein [Verrucomicrobiaceae bacterium]